MSDRIRLVYDDDTHIDFNTAADAIFHCYGPEGLRGVVRLETVDPEAEERARQVLAAQAQLEAAGVTDRIKAPDTGARPLMDREQLAAAVGALVENPDVPLIVQITDPSPEQSKQQEETVRAVFAAVDTPDTVSGG
jgi:hypothetical protein